MAYRELRPFLTEDVDNHIPTKWADKMEDRARAVYASAKRSRFFWLGQRGSEKEVETARHTFVTQAKEVNVSACSLSYLPLTTDI